MIDAPDDLEVPPDAPAPPPPYLSWASTQVDVLTHDMQALIAAAGGDAGALPGTPTCAVYVDGVLHVPGVTQAALDAALAAYDPAATEARALAALKTRLAVDINAAAETVRCRYITPGSGMAMVYLQKQTQAALALNAAAATAAATKDQNAALYPLLAAEIGLTLDPQTGAPAADVLGVARAIQAVVQSWIPIAATIERARMTATAAIAAAPTAAAAQAAHDAVTWPAA